jgi:APA family basic amino acid/polyamine antiporter
MSQPADDAATPLERGLGTFDATMIVMGSMIGSGIFIVSADVARLVGSPGWLLIAWALAGVLTVAGAVCSAEVAAMIPRAGGQYVFLREAFGPSVGFLFGWSTFLVVGTGTIAAVAVAFAKFLGVFIPQISAKTYIIEPIHLGSYAVSLTTQQMVAIGLIIFLSLINTRGLRTGSRIQNVFTFAKTAALIGLVIVGLLFGRNAAAAFWTSNWWNSAANGWTLEKAQTGLPAFLGTLAFALVLGKAMVGPLFSQTAWNTVTFTGGEIREPGKTLPRALVIGCSTVVLLYMLANVAYLVTLPLDQIQNADQDRVGTATMKAVMGDAGTYLMAACILVSTFGCVNGLVLACARVYYAMARDGLFFAAAGRTNPRHVPGSAILMQMVWACLLTLPITVSVNPTTQTVEYGNLYGQLLDYIIPVDLLFYTLMVIAVFVFRKTRPTADRPYRTWGYPVTPAIHVALAAFLIIDFVYLSPHVSGIGFLIALSGLPVYAIWSRMGKRPSHAALD